jgi:Ca-activated chloride channel family protein
MKKFTTIILFVLINVLFAEGLMIPSNENYPKDLLRNRSTTVNVDIHGLISETFVYQEFVNEWTDSTDAVYNFPLPPDARATEFVYWYKDTAYKAILKVKEQATNPGTGEGGIVAEINNYIGRNGIKVFLKDIPAGGIQKVMLHYISRCDYYQGKVTYNFPLNTSAFITYPLEQLQFNINVYSNSGIKNYSSTFGSQFKLIESTPNVLKVEVVKPKAYLTKDFDFTYEVDQSELNVDFYSVASDSGDGHFALFVRPQNVATADSVFPRRIIFLLSNSSEMTGNKLSQSISAISKSLDQLTTKDEFNIVLFNYYVYPWKTAPIPVSEQNILDAKTYLASVTASWGSRMDAGLEECLNEIKNNSFSNAILAFTNGRTPLDPRNIETKNTFKTGIFPIGIGDNLDRARLEMTAQLNYGFVTYIDEDDNLSEKMNRVFDLISQPILKDVGMEYGRADLSSILPEKLPSTYAGSYFYALGRYSNPGESILSIAGNSISGTNFYDFRLNYSSQTNQQKFVESLWAKEMIDQLEWIVEIYGETAALKDSLIDLSLKYGIRCRYTAYVADYEEPWVTPVENEKFTLVPDSYIVGNYPNPFNPATTIRFHIDAASAGKVKFIKIFDALGRLVRVIDVTEYGEGFFEIHFDGKDQYGQTLSSGIYIVQLQIDSKPSNAIKITFLK